MREDGGMLASLTVSLIVCKHSTGELFSAHAKYLDINHRYLVIVPHKGIKVTAKYMGICALREIV